MSENERNILERFGQILRSLRRGRPVQEIEELSGIPYYTIGRYERGEAKTLPFDDVVRLASVYNLSPNDIAELLGLYESLESLEERSSPQISKMLKEQRSFLAEVDEDEQELLADTVVALIRVRRGQLAREEQHTPPGQDLDLPEHIRKKVWN